LQAEKQSGEKKEGGLASGHKSGGLVLVLALGPSTRPKNATDLTVIFPDNMFPCIFGYLQE
jgi:hypothetical protein